MVFGKDSIASTFAFSAKAKLFFISESLGANNKAFS